MAALSAVLPTESPAHPVSENNEAKTETIKLVDEKTTAERTNVFNPASANKKSTYRSRMQDTMSADTEANAAAVDDDGVIAAPKKSQIIKEVQANKKAGWVVQMGSFNNKNNAKHLTSLLRAKGYTVFTYEAKRSGQIRVCVGPEKKQMSAVILAKKIERDFKLRGIVKNYNPLDL